MSGLVFSRGLFMSYAAAGLVLVRANNKQGLSSDFHRPIGRTLEVTHWGVLAHADSAAGPTCAWRSPSTRDFPALLECLRSRWRFEKGVRRRRCVPLGDASLTFPTRLGLFAEGQFGPAMDHVFHDACRGR